jgi:hypothetical protein
VAELKPYWEQLFVAEEASQTAEAPSYVPMRSVRRQGHPFLLLPANRTAAQTTLTLYPAQTAKGRFGRFLLRALLKTPVARLLDQVQVPVHTAAALTRMVAKLSPSRGKQPNLFGILAGNPASPGQRYLLLLFGPQATPVAVVKAGLTPQARELVEAETRVLTAAAGEPGVPHLKESLTGESLSAFALDYYSGESPRLTFLSAGRQGHAQNGSRQARTNSDEMTSLLISWLRPGETRRMTETAAWHRLETRLANGAGVPDVLEARALMPALARAFQKAPLVAALQHGDFAPWNIKVSAEGHWTVLDWERGDLHGVPGWDWFHYVLQQVILVQRLDTARLKSCAGEMLAAPRFQAYARQAGMLGIERELLLTYLLYMLHVVRPSEGLEATQNLLRALALES